MNSASANPAQHQKTGESKSVLISLKRKHMHADQGFAYICELPLDILPGDSEEAPWWSRAVLFEDGVVMGPAHVQHHLIRSKGGGRFSHWGRELYFSSSDNSSPLNNGRHYHLLLLGHTLVLSDETLTTDEWTLNKMAPMERFHFARRLYRKMWKDTPLPDHGRLIDHDVKFAEEFKRLSPESDVTHERKYNLNQLFKLVRHTAGDVAECGVYKGGSAFFLARRILEQKLDKRLCLFDSFEGLSTPGRDDGDYWQAGVLASPIDEVRNALALLGPPPFVEFYKGWIPERFPDIADRHFCFVHIDVDLYQPTLDSISFFYPRMTPGGLILLDDYGFTSCPGVTKAIDGFMADKAEPIINLASGGAFILKRAA